MSDTVSFRIALSAEDAARYEKMAAAKKLPVEIILMTQLARFSASASEKPIVIEDSERRELEALAKRSIGKGADIIRIVREATALDCGGAAISIEPAMLARVRRIAPKRIPWPQFLGGYISRMLANSQEV